MPHDLTAGLVVFLVALPLCLGVALASNAPLFSGIVTGIIAGIVVGILSQSHTSVSGPAAGLTAVVAAQIAVLGSFEAFLVAVLIAGVIQVILGVSQAGFIAAFFPSSVIRGLLAAIGVILILKQIPHVLGHDTDPEGDMAFQQPDRENTFSEIGALIFDIHWGAAVVGLSSLALLILWDRIKPLKRSIVPAPLLVVLLGTLFAQFLRTLGGQWAIGSRHLVQVPVTQNFQQFAAILQFPDFSQWHSPLVLTSGVTIALVASLETLLNLEAVDRLDPEQRTSPPSRELIAQGCGNILCGFLGGLPMTSVVIRSSVNIQSGVKTKLSTIVHGLLLLSSVLFFARWLNLIPLSCLAAILLVTGIKLASPQLVRQMWQEGKHQFLPFAVTVISIVLTDLLIGVLIGLGVSLAFILRSNMRAPIRKIVEHQLGGDVIRIELANQVSFLNRAALNKELDAIAPSGQLLLDAHQTDYIDPDVLALIREFKEHTAPARGIEVSLLGFRKRYHLQDENHIVDHATEALQSSLTPAQTLELLKAGHQRFLTGRQIKRDYRRQLHETAAGQHPLAVVLGCIDSRTPVELIFDLGLGDILSVRVAGNVLGNRVLGSIEYACAVAGAKLIVVLGHTRCGTVAAAVELAKASDLSARVTGCQHLDLIIGDLQQSIRPRPAAALPPGSETEKQEWIDTVARDNVRRTVHELGVCSDTLNVLFREGRIDVVGAMYDVATGQIEFLNELTD